MTVLICDAVNDCCVGQHSVDGAKIFNYTDFIISRENIISMWVNEPYFTFLNNETLVNSYCKGLWTSSTEC